MKTVTFDEYREFVKAGQGLHDHFTEGYEVCCCQWLDEQGIVQAQSTYQATPIGEPCLRTYQIREAQHENQHENQQEAVV